MKNLVIGGACILAGLLLTALMEAGTLLQAGVWAAAMALLLVSAGLTLEILGLREQ
ncbi:hypothetical protein [uncultured Pseudoflavonifractor sp.]|uniref:hypothetical protein n=1 Tax=uncultured Pseudoflavonifractor sp. TaxID=1221379 RepID=UPI0025D7AD8E|nr:hypothetical protein [uncultured Pseudoflavonifractor sp.]